MKIEKDSVATIHYTLTNEEGEVLDTSQGGDPLKYLQGHGNLVPGLEKELEGKKPGDSFKTVVEPAEAYGEYDDNLIFTVEKSEFEDPDQLEIGTNFQAEIGGDAKLCTVMDLGEDTVKFNANHPLSGMTLSFDISVQDVRSATEEELEHGHVHGDGGHHH